MSTGFLSLRFCFLPSGHDNSYRDRGGDSAAQRAFRAILSSRADILRHKGGHGLHVSGRHQHEERTHLLGYAHTGGRDDTHGVYNRLDNQKGHADQQFLQGYR